MFTYLLTITTAVWNAAAAFSW